MVIVKVYVTRRYPHSKQKYAFDQWKESQESTIKSKCQDISASIRGFNDDHVGYLRLANRKMPDFCRGLRENASFKVGRLQKSRSERVRRKDRQVQVADLAAYAPFCLDCKVLWTEQRFCMLPRVQEAAIKDETVRIKAILPTEAGRRLKPRGQDSCSRGV